MITSCPIFIFPIVHYTLTTNIDYNTLILNVLVWRSLLLDYTVLCCQGFYEKFTNWVIPNFYILKHCFYLYVYLNLQMGWRCCVQELCKRWREKIFVHKWHFKIGVSQEVYGKICEMKGDMYTGVYRYGSW